MCKVIVRQYRFVCVAASGEKKVIKKHLTRNQVTKVREDLAKQYEKVNVQYRDRFIPEIMCYFGTIA
jgi:hypothetical protein